MNEVVNNYTLASLVSEVVEMPLDQADAVVSAIFESVADALRAGDRVSLAGDLGQFRVSEQSPPWVGRDTETGLRVVVPRKVRILFDETRSMARLLKKQAIEEAFWTPELLAMKRESEAAEAAKAAGGDPEPVGD